MSLRQGGITTTASPIPEAIHTRLEIVMQWPKGRYTCVYYVTVIPNFFLSEGSQLIFWHIRGSNSGAGFSRRSKPIALAVDRGDHGGIPWQLNLPPQ